MSGHSKWATIHRQKEIKDAHKGQIFTKMANAITIAVRAGGGISDSNTNFRLRLAIEKAKAANTPNDNIQRAIKAGIGNENSSSWEEINYEGFASGGVVVIVETATNNKNRTSSLIRNLFEKSGGSMGTPGAVSFQFKRIGLIRLKKEANFEEQELYLIDLGAEDIVELGDNLEVYFPVERLNEIKNKLEEQGKNIFETEIILKPTSLITISDIATVQKIIKFIDTLEEQDDVQRVYTNFDIAAEISDKI